MKFQKHRWSRAYESAEEELITQLQAKHLTTQRWTAEAYQHFDEQTLAHDRQVWCAEGSLVFRSNDGSSSSLQAGDTLVIPATLSHTADAGISGCVCYEASR